MGKFIVELVNLTSGLVEEVLDEEFDTYEEAVEYAVTCSSDFSTGAEVLELAGESYLDPDDYEYVAREK